MDIQIDQSSLMNDPLMGMNNLEERDESEFSIDPISMTIPLKGQRKYSTIKSVSFTEPTDAIDLVEMLGGMMGGLGL